MEKCKSYWCCATVGVTALIIGLFVGTGIRPKAVNSWFYKSKIEVHLKNGKSFNYKASGLYTDFNWYPDLNGIIDARSSKAAGDGIRLPAGVQQTC